MNIDKYKMINDILKDASQEDTKSILWDLLTERYESEVIKNPYGRENIIDEIQRRKERVVEAIRDTLPQY